MATVRRSRLGTNHGQAVWISTAVAISALSDQRSAGAGPYAPRPPHPAAHPVATPTAAVPDSLRLDRFRRPEMVNRIRRPPSRRRAGDASSICRVCRLIRCGSRQPAGGRALTAGCPTAPQVSPRTSRADARRAFGARQASSHKQISGAGRRPPTDQQGSERPTSRRSRSGTSATTRATKKAPAQRSRSKAHLEQYRAQVRKRTSRRRRLSSNKKSATR